MRFLHVGKYFPPVPGGMERFLGDLVQAQRAQGDEPSVLVHGDPLPGDPPWLERCPVLFRLVFAPVSVVFPLRLRAAIRRHAPDALHLHLPNPSAFWALLLPSARQLPWVVHWHSDVEPSRHRLGLRLLYPFYHLFERAVLERADCVIASSPPYLESSRVLEPWREKCVVVPLGLDPARLPPVAPGEGRDEWGGDGLRVLAVGRLTYYKGFAGFARAAGATPGLDVVIAGEGEERPRIERAIAASGGRSPVRLAGEVDDARLCRLLASCDVLCLPSIERTEAFGIVLMEAMRYGRPVMVSALAGSGMTWIARDGENGVHVAPGDELDWARQLAKLADDPERRARLGAAGATRFAEEFTIGAVARRVREIALRAERVRDDLPPAMTPDPGRTLVVIPALNEASCIGEVIDGARAACGADVLVVDDGSTDGTPEVARSRGAMVARAPLWQGAWGAIQTGLRHAVRHGYGRVITMDADGQHEASYLPALLAAGREADVVIAACPERGSFLRHVAWRYFRLLTGFAIEDLTSGFRLYNPDACRLLVREEATLLDYQDIGVLLMLRRAHLRIAEIPVRMNPRRSGASRVFSSWWTVGLYMAETSLLCLARWGRPGAPARSERP